MWKDSLRVLCEALIGLREHRGGQRGGVRESRTVMGVALALLLLSTSGSVWARPFGGGGGFPGGVLGQLIYPCQAACRDTARDCSTAAEDEAVACIQNACATETETAESACVDDRTSQACKTAVTALRTCGASCLITLKSEVASCRAAQTDCVTACTAD